MNMQVLTRVIPPIIILAAGAWGWKHYAAQIQEDKEEVERRAPNLQQTRVQTLHAENYQVVLTTQGVVRAGSSTNLTPEVSGRVKRISPAFEDGAMFKEGDVLLEIDATEFEVALTNSKASLARAEANLAQEQARADQALRNWQDIGLKEKPNDLVLRKPQLKEAEANVLAQQAALAQAKRNLERCKVLAPYDGRVRKRLVGLGQTVGTGTSLGEIFSTAYAELRLPLSTRQLAQLHIKDSVPPSLEVTLNDSTSKSAAEWSAKVVRMEGELDPDSRELFVIARIEDPYGLTNNKEAIRINQSVNAHIKANTIENAYVISREHLYGENEIVIVKPDHTIARQHIDILWKTHDTVVTSDATLSGVMLATSRLNYTPTGAKVNVITDPPATTAQH